MIRVRIDLALVVPRARLGGFLLLSSLLRRGPQDVLHQHRRHQEGRGAQRHQRLRAKRIYNRRRGKTTQHARCDVTAADEGEQPLSLPYIEQACSQQAQLHGGEDLDRIVPDGDGNGHPAGIGEVQRQPQENDSSGQGKQRAGEQIPKAEQRFDFAECEAGHRPNESDADEHVGQGSDILLPQEDGVRGGFHPLPRKADEERMNDQQRQRSPLAELDLKHAR